MRLPHKLPLCRRVTFHLPLVPRCHAWLVLLFCLIITSSHSWAACSDATPGASSQEVLARARACGTAESYDEALSVYQDYLALHPEDDAARAAAARILSWQGKYDEAVTLYLDILDRHPVDLEVRTALARVKSWQRKFTEAQVLYTRILVEQPHNIEAKRGLADTLYWSGNFSRALSLYEDVFAFASDAEVADRIQAVRAELAAAQSSSLRHAPLHELSDDSSPSPRNFVKLGYRHFTYTKHLPDEKNWFLEVSRPWQARTFTVRFESLERFGLHDSSLSGELYSPLWQGAWGYGLSSVGIGTHIVPRWTVGGELFQSLSVFHPLLAFLDVSFGYRRLSFRDATINILSPGITWYVSHNLWLTEKMYYVPDTESKSLSSTLTWRPNNRFQAFAAGTFGNAGERVGALQDLVRTDTLILQGGVTFPVSKNFSIEVSGYYEDRDAQYVRRGVSFALISYW